MYMLLPFKLLEKKKLWASLEKYNSCVPAPKAEECFHFQMMHFASAAAQASLTQRIFQYFLVNKYFAKKERSNV